MAYCVRKGDRWGLVDESGHFVVPPFYERLGNVSAYALSYALASKVGFIDNSGAQIIPARFDYEPSRMPAFYEGLAAVAQEGRYGYIGQDGEWRIAAVWDRCWDFVGHRALVESNEGYFVIDDSGEILSKIEAVDMPFERRWPQEWSCIRSLQRHSGSLLTAFVAWTGKLVFAPRFPHMTDFSSGASLYCEHEDSTINPWGLIDVSGRILQPPTFIGISPFSDKAARAAVAPRQVGFINTQGDWIIEPIYEQAGPFSEGLACVAVKGKKGFINSAGDMVIEPRFDREATFHGGVAEVFYHGKSLFINRSGRVLVESQ